MCAKSHADQIRGEALPSWLEWLPEMPFEMMAVGVGVLAYIAYLGGRLVYDVGAGVEPAHGVHRVDAPKLKSGQIGAFFRAAASDLVHGVQHMVQELGKGKFVPTIVAWCEKSRAASWQSKSPPPP